MSAKNTFSNPGDISETGTASTYLSCENTKNKKQKLLVPRIHPTVLLVFSGNLPGKVALRYDLWAFV